MQNISQAAANLPGGLGMAFSAPGRRLISDIFD